LSNKSFSVFLFLKFNLVDLGKSLLIINSEDFNWFSCSVLRFIKGVGLLSISGKKLNKLLEASFDLEIS
jgi:hypothetical protein